MKSNFIISIFNDRKSTYYFQPFIRAHIDRLPCKVKFFYGDKFLWKDENDKFIIPLWLNKLCLFFEEALNKRNFDRIKIDWVAKFLKKSNIALVLAEFGPNAVKVIDICKKTKLPLIVHFHGYDAYDNRVLNEYIFSYKEVFGYASKIIVVSKDMEKQLINLGAPIDKIFYNPCGVDTNIFKGANPALSEPVFVSITRFVDKKAPHLVILAFKKVIDYFKDARLIMIGDGPLLESCIQLTKALKIKDAVSFKRVGLDVEIVYILRQARAYVQHSITTSYGDSEGTPVAILEAQATGLPVVSTRHAGIKDVVIDKETGFLVDEFDMDGMAEYMIRLIEDPQLADRLGKKGRERICSDFSIEKSIRNLWNIIYTTINNKN